MFLIFVERKRKMSTIYRFKQLHLLLLLYYIDNIVLYIDPHATLITRILTIHNY